MSSYRDLEIYQMAFDLSMRVHNASLLLPKYELYEQGSQVRRSTKSVKDQIAEGYGRKRYKADFIKYLVYAQASCDEATNQLAALNVLYKDLFNWKSLLEEYNVLGKKINSFISYVDKNWKT